MRKNILISLLASMIAFSASAQQYYTIEDCRSLALKNNIKLKNSNLDIQIAEQTSKEAFTKYFPTIKAIGIGFKTNLDIYAKYPGFFSGEFNTLDQGIMGNISAFQLLYAGRQVANANKLSRLNESVMSLKKEQTEDEIILNTEQIFWQIITLQEKKKTVDAALAQLENLHKDAQLAIKAGISTKNDLLRVELQQQQYESMRSQLESGLSILHMQLGQYMGIGLFSEFELEAGDISNPQIPLNYYINSSEAVSTRIEYKLLDKNIDAAKIQKDREVGKYMPTVGVGAIYLYHDMKDNFLNVNSSLISSQIAGVMQNTESSIGNHGVGVLSAFVSIPISDWWGGSHAIKRENLKIEQAISSRQNAVELLTMQIEQTWNELQESYRQILIAKKSIESASENMRENNDFYRAGVGTMSDVLDAQTLLQKSKDRLVETCTNYQIKLQYYLQITGR